VLSFDLSGKGGPTSSYATAGIALWIIVPRKPPYPAKDAFVKVEIPQGGGGVISTVVINQLIVVMEKCCFSCEVEIEFLNNISIM